MNIPERQEQLDALIRKHLAKPERNGHEITRASILSDEAIIALCRKAKNAAKFADLYDAGSTERYGGDDSAADLGLLGMLAFYTQDAEQLERIVSGSALGQRGKWQDRSDYRERTIDKALSNMRETYTPSKAPVEDAPKSRFQRADLASALEHGVEPEEMLVDDVLYAPTEVDGRREGRVHAVYAKGGTGKTYLALWIMKWLLIDDKPVVFLDQENGIHTIVDRLASLGVKTEYVRENLHYYPFPSAPVDDEALAEFQQILDDVQPALVVFDSWINFLAAAGMSEDSSNDVAAWSEAYAQRARRSGASVLLLDHVPKEGHKGARGSGRKRDYVDVMWELLNPMAFDRQTMGRIELRKQKDRQGWMPHGVAFNVGTADNGKFVFGKAVFDSSASTAGTLTNKERRTLEVLKSFGDSGAKAADWRSETMSRCAISDATFWRHLRALRDSKLVVEADGRYFCKSPANGNCHPLSNHCHDSSDSELLGTTVTTVTPLKGDSSDSSPQAGSPPRVQDDTLTRQRQVREAWKETHTAPKVIKYEDLSEEDRRRLQNAERGVVVHTEYGAAIYCGRGKRGTRLKKSKRHNPFQMDYTKKDGTFVKRDGTREEVIEKHKRYLEGPVADYTGMVHDGRPLKDDLHELRGKILVCHCAPEACHCDHLLKLANAPAEDRWLTQNEWDALLALGALGNAASYSDWKHAAMEYRDLTPAKWHVAFDTLLELGRVREDGDKYVVCQREESDESEPS